MLSLLGLFLLGMTRAAYDEAKGYTGVFFSAAAYCEATTIEKWKCGMSCNLAPTLSNVIPIMDQSRGSYGFVGYNNAT